MVQSLWNDNDTAGLDELGLLAYRSNRLGADRSVSNWAGGNTSMKQIERDFRGRAVQTLWVKGSGTDLGTITRNGFAAVRMDDALPLLERGTMSDDEMVSYLAHCSLHPNMPRASIETLLHAFLPAKHVDHVHADAIVTFCCAPGSEGLTREVFGDEVLWVPYIRPGFPLSKLIAETMHKRPQVRAVFMAKHGLVTWGDTAAECYRNSLEYIQRAEDYIRQQTGSQRPLGRLRFDALPRDERRVLMAKLLPVMRGMLSDVRPMILHYDDLDETLAFAGSDEARQYALTGTACPDHLVHTKPWPLWLEPQSFEPDALAAQLRAELDQYKERYRAYYAREHARAGDNFEMDDPNPRIILVPRVGMIATGKDVFWARTAGDIFHRAMAVIRGLWALGGFVPLNEAEDYDVEYWPLERYKLTLQAPPRELSGRVALVTGGAGGIGRAIALRLAQEGAHVVIADLNGEAAQAVAGAIEAKHGAGRALAVCADVTREAEMVAAFEQAITAYGGLDILIANAGIAGANAIEDVSLAEWERLQGVLSTGYFLAAREAFRAMKAQARGGQIVFIVSKNGLAPGRKAAAYSAAKAAELHLARCLAEEGGPFGIRVNSVCPDAVIEGSGIWNSAWREARAKEYGIAPDQIEEFYRKRSTLKVNVYPDDIAEAAYFLLSSRAAKSTGAVLTVDGGIPGAYVR